MAEISQNTNLSVTGKGKLKVGNETLQWSNGWLAGIDVWSGNDARTFTTNITLKGQDWATAFIRVTGEADMKLKLIDKSTGDGGHIEHLILGNAGSNIKLDRSRVEFINTHSDGVDNVTIGRAGAGSVKLGDGNDTLVLGTGRVDTVQMGDGNDKVTGGAAGGETVHLGQGNNTFIGGNGYINAVIAWSGNDRITVRDGGVGVIDTGQGNDVVTVNKGNVDAINLGDGNNTLTLAGTGWIGAIVAYNGDDTVTLAGNAEFTGSINLGGGDNTVTTGASFVNAIFTNAGDDIITVGAGGVGNVTSWGGENRIVSTGWIGAVLLGHEDDQVIFNAGGESPSVNLRGGDDRLTVSALSESDSISVVQGGAGTDLLSFASFTTALTLSLASSDPANTGAGFFIIVGFENLRGGSNNDTLEGSDDDNVLDGRAGNDVLTGAGGVDTFVYADGFDDDTITDFSIAEDDTVDLRGLTGVVSFSDLVANHLSQGGSGAEITGGNGDVLVLTGIDMNDLTSAQFIFA